MESIGLVGLRRQDAVVEGLCLRRFALPMQRNRDLQRLG
jgi:hypothetical protein